MIIFLYGHDSYRKNIKLKEILADYKNKHSKFTVEYFDLSAGASTEEGINKLKDFIKSKSLFDDFQLGIVRGGNLLEDKNRKEFISLLKGEINEKELILIVLEDRALIADFKFLLKKPILSQRFESLDELELADFVLKESRERGIILDERSRDLLIGLYKGDTWSIVTELEKLSLLNEKKINKEVLEKHIDAFLPIDIFAMLNRLNASQKIGERLAILEELFVKGGDPAIIFNFLSVLIKNHWDKQKMADYDAAIKSGKLDYEEALTDLVISG